MNAATALLARAREITDGETATTPADARVAAIEKRCNAKGRTLDEPVRAWLEQQPQQWVDSLIALFDELAGAR